MLTVLLKTFSFIAIIALGFTLKRTGKVQTVTIHLLTWILLHLTLPATVIYAFGSLKRDPTLFLIIVLGFFCALIPMLLIGYTSRHLPPNDRAFAMINVTGFNIGAFTLPFIGTFFGSEGLIYACLFDVGNAVMVTGGSYVLTQLIVKNTDSVKLNLWDTVKRFISSVPFDTYMLMLVLFIADIAVPSSICTLLEPLAKANAFVAMLLIGMMFDFRASAEKYRLTIKVLTWRVVAAIIFAVGVVLYFPVAEPIKAVLAVTLFAPVSSLSPIYTDQIGSDSALSSLTLSISIPIAVAFMLAIVMLMHVA